MSKQCEPREKAIAYIEECRGIHQTWVDLQVADDEWVNEVVSRSKAGGDKRWHRKWIKRYDLVLAVLRSEMAA